MKLPDISITITLDHTFLPEFVGQQVIALTIMNLTNTLCCGQTHIYAYF